MTYTLRVMMVILKWLLILALVSGLMVLTFITFMNMTNIAVLVNDGMDMRAEVVFGLEGQEELFKFFTGNCISADSMLTSNVYTDYDIKTFTSMVEMDKLTTMPWSDSASVMLTYTIPAIEGSLPVALQTPEQLAMPDKIPPPPWQGGKYTLNLIKVEGQWKIASLTLVESISPTAPPAITPPS